MKKNIEEIKKSFSVVRAVILAILISLSSLAAQPAKAIAPYPDSSTAGLTDSSNLTPFSGQYDISADNTVLENMDIHGYLTVQGENITIRNVRINTDQDSGIFFAVRVYSGSVTLQNVEIIGGEAAAVTGTGFTIKDSYIHNFNGDGIVPANAADGITIQNNYIYDQSGFGSAFHRDGIQIQSGINNTVIKHNHIDIGTVGSLTSPIFVANDLGPDGNGPLLIEDNLLSGGSYNIGAFKDGDNGSNFNITVRFNRLTDAHETQYCNMTDTSADVQWYGNVKDSDNSLIPECNNMISPDVTAPVTSITSPTSGATVSGTTTISATATDDSATVSKVEFYVDGNLLSTDTNSPYSASWDTTTASNGSHTLTTKAYDPSNNVGTSSAVAVTVANAAPPAPDDDHDGVPNAIENAGPNGGDANGDGIADSQQASVATYKNTKSDAYNTVEAGGSCPTLQSVTYASSSNANLPAGQTNIFGQLGFSMQCASSGQTGSVKLFLDKVYTTSTLRVHKVNASTGGTSDITDKVSFGTATVANHQVTTISYDITDGSMLDQDGSANGVIVDPVVIAESSEGLANTGQSLISTVLIGMTLVIAGTAGVVLVRKHLLFNR